MNIFYFPCNNLGDLFNIYIAIYYGFNYKSVKLNKKNWTGINNDNGIFLIGSILKYCGTNSKIMGVGFKHEFENDENKTLVQNNDILYVRGKFTKKLLLTMDKEKEYNLEKIKIFEPGLLLSTFMKPNNFPQKNILIIPHNSHLDLLMNLDTNINLLSLMFKNEEYNFITKGENNQKIIKIFEEKFSIINKYEIIFSSSLHGLCFAIALNKKFVWFKMNNHDEPAFKYLDFFSYFNKDIKCLDLSKLILDNKLDLNLSKINDYINYIDVSEYKDEIKNFEKELLQIKNLL